MTAESRVKFCIYCDRPIEGGSIKVADDKYRHIKGDSACRPRPLLIWRARGRDVEQR